MITREQIDVPVEGHTEAGARLLLRRLTMGIEDGEVALLREFAKNRREILDRMADQETDAERHDCRSQARSSAAASARVDSRAE